MKFYLYNEDGNVLDRSSNVMDRDDVEGNRDIVKLFDSRDEAEGARWAIQRHMRGLWYVGEKGDKE